MNAYMNTYIHKYIQACIHICCIRLCIYLCIWTLNKYYIPRSAHISTFIRDSLRWLPIHQRIHFKFLTLMTNCLVGFVPPTCWLFALWSPFSLAGFPYGRLSVASSWLPVCAPLRPNPGVSFLLARPTGIVFLRSYGRNCLVFLPLSSASAWKLSWLSVMTLAGVGSTIGLSVFFQFRLQL